MDFTMLKDFMEHLTDWRIPGNAISVYHDNKEVFRYSSGYADIENKVPMTGDEYVNIYSCTKIATVVAALKLYEQGKLLLNDPLYYYIPEYESMRYKDENGNVKDCQKHILVKDLFTMTAGLNYDLNSEAIEKAKEITNGKMDTVSVAKCLADSVLDFEPGTRWQYSLCHDVLAALVEIISGEKFGEYVKKNIFEPIGVKDIYFHRTPEVKEKMAEQYFYETENGTNDYVEAEMKVQRQNGKIVNVGKDVSFVFGENYDSGGAGMTTTVADYAKFLNVLVNKGKTENGETVICENTVKLLKTNHLLNEEIRKEFNNFSWTQFAGYGYGLGVRTMMNIAEGGSNGSIGEFGWGGAAGAYALCDTDLNLAVFYAHHMLNPQSEYVRTRLRNIVYSCFR